MQALALPTKRVPTEDPLFDRQVHAMQDMLDTLLQQASPVLFTTDATGLFQVFLDALPSESRPHFHCHTCKQFIEQYGHIIAVDEAGTRYSPFWEAGTLSPYVAPFAALQERVLGARITGVFYAATPDLGTPACGGWTHFAVRLPESYCALHRRPLTPWQASAEKREDFHTVMRALGEFGPRALEQAIRILESEALYRSEHLLGAAQWLAGLHAIQRNTRNPRVREALLWRSVALAPSGFCHPRSGMLGTLLDDIHAGLPMEELKRRFDAKMQPHRYQRPQAAPTQEALAAAEKLVQDLGVEASLKRRFARLDEVTTFWTPKAAPGATGTLKVFGHLMPTQAEAFFDMPARTMTWEKFAQKVLLEAESMEFLVPPGAASYVFHTTAVDADAPPILQWDTPEARNPVAWYVYASGLSPALAGVTPGYREVTAVMLQPSLWGERPLEHHGESVTFCLVGCRDMQNAGGLGLFPEILKAELHGVRSVIEAFSRKGRIEATEGPLANGIRLQKGFQNYGTFRVTTRGQRTVYILDRWE